MKVINLTPHAINVVDKETKEILITFPKSENPARLPTSTVVSHNIEINEISIPVTKTAFDYNTATNLPLTQEGNVFYIVSRIILSAFPERNDLLVPNELVRDASGNIIGCSSLAIK